MYKAVNAAIQRNARGKKKLSRPANVRNKLNSRQSQDATTKACSNGYCFNAKSIMKKIPTIKKFIGTWYAASFAHFTMPRKSVAACKFVKLYIIYQYLQILHLLLRKQYIQSPVLEVGLLTS